MNDAKMAAVAALLQGILGHCCAIPLTRGLEKNMQRKQHLRRL